MWNSIVNKYSSDQNKANISLRCVIIYKHKTLYIYIYMYFYNTHPVHITHSMVSTFRYVESVVN